MNYNTLDARLKGRNGQPVDQRKVGNNTYAHRRDDGGIGVRLHDTDVVVHYPDGRVKLDTGGWFTVTTKARINEWAGPFGVVSAGGTWTVVADNPAYVDRPYWDEVRNERNVNERTPVQRMYRVTVGTFYDGMVLDGNNPTATLDTPAEVQAAMATDVETKRAVAQYLKGLTADVLRQSIDNRGGDCWGCMFGEIEAFGVDHLREHLREGYYVAHLFLNALKAAGYRDPGFIMGTGSVDLVKRATRRYLHAKLLTGPASGRRGKADALTTGF